MEMVAVRRFIWGGSPWDGAWMYAVLMMDLWDLQCKSGESLQCE